MTDQTVKAGWVVLAALVFIGVTTPFVLLALPFYAMTFFLGMAAVIRGKAWHGVGIMIGSILAPTILYLTKLA
jgi:hypothetical protein